MLAGLGDKLLLVFASIMEWLYKSFVKPFEDLPTLKKLVFGTHKEGDLIWGTFEPSNLTNGFEPLFHNMMILAGFALVMLIVTYAMRIAGAPLNPSRRNEGIEFIKDLVFVGIVLTNLPVIYDLLFTINSAIVGLFQGALESNIDDIRNEPIDAEDPASGLIGWIFAQLVLVGLTIWASFYYLMRKITLLILMGMGPLMVVFWLQPQFKGMTSAWFKELIGSIFVQAIHAFVFWTVAVVSTTSTGFVETVIVYVIFIPIAESIRRLLNMGGDMQGGFAKAGAMMGMAGLAGMYGAAKGAFDGKSVMSTVKGAYDGTKKGTGKDGEGKEGEGSDLKDTLGGMPGTDGGTTPRAEKMLRAGDIMGKMGKATMGAAGAVAGMGLGPIGSMAGSTAGFAAGGVLGGLTGRAGAALSQGLADRVGKGIKDGQENFKKNQDGSDDLDENFANEMADRDTSDWANAHKDQQMNALRERFPDASQAELDKKFDQVKASKRAGFYNSAKDQLRSARETGGASGSAVEQAATQIANQDIANWESDNKASEMQRIQQQNPNATPEMVEASYQQLKASKRQGFYNDAKSQLGNIQSVSMGNPQLENQATQMANEGIANWENSNKAAEIQKIQQQNPNATPEMVEASYQQIKASKRQGFYNDAKSQLGAGQSASTASSIANYANEVADRNVASWENSNKAAEMQKIQQQNPNATPEMMEASYQQVKASKRQGFYNDAKSQISSIQPMLNGSEAVESVGQAMANQWSADNKSAFNQNYAQNNPIQEGESQEAYAGRRQAAFNKKVSAVKDSFVSAGRAYVDDNTTEDSGYVTKDGFIGHMSQAATSVGSSGSLGVENIVRSGQNAMQHTQGANLFNDKGTPNISALSSRMAEDKTSQMKNQFVASQVASGIDSVAANQDWQDNHQPKVYSQNLKNYQDSFQSAVANSEGFKGSTVGNVLQSAGVGVGSMVGITAGAQKLKSSYQAVMDGGRVAIAQANNLSDQGANPAKVVYGAAQSGWQHTLQSTAEQAGGAIEAHAAHQEKAGYAAGVVFGGAGYSKAKNLANRFSPYARQVQASIHSPSEVMQMAKTTTDNQGNPQIADGAVRQVITSDGSHIEVMTKSGETQVVSRKGAGHSGLKKGEVIYQDLGMENDQLVSTSDAYRVDSGGARVRSSANVQNNPNSLLNTASASFGNDANVRQNAPVYSQAVDSGSFYSQDLASGGFENVQVIVEKDRQFVTGEKEGMTYRVSPVFAGDTRLGNDQTVSIPVQAQEHGLLPKTTTNSSVAVQGNMSVNGVQVEDEVPYYSTKSTSGLLDNIDELIQSKHHNRASKSLDKRQQLENVRRKQGILG